jgi:hypothetical protein
MRHRVTAALAVGALPCLNDAPANAAEGGIGAYLMGSRSNGAGVGSTNISAGRGPRLVQGTCGRARRRHWLHV